MTTKIEEFAVAVAEYITHHDRYDFMNGAECVREAITLVLSDIGCAQAFLNALEVPWDLYENKINHGVVKPSIKYGEHKWGRLA